MTELPNAPATPSRRRRRAVIFGAGPGGLMAAEVLAAAGADVTVYDRMPSPARKFLMAGRGGLNLTHSEDLPQLLARFDGSAAGLVRQAITAFPPAALISWCEGLGESCFTGSSGRVFPKSFKASPLLRAWLTRLQGLGVRIEMRRSFTGFTADGAALCDGAPIAADAVLLALGGASWPRLGADGSWQTAVAERGIALEPLTPSNCGVTIPWSSHIGKHEGQPLKRIAVRCGSSHVRGEAIITRTGLEGGAIYALSAVIRAELAAHGSAQLLLDLRPDLSEAELTRRLEVGRKGQSVANLLRKSAGLSPAAAAVLREAPLPPSAALLARAIKSVPLTITGLSGMARAISSAGGIAAGALDGRFMLSALPGVFAAGEMLDADAPTGGYLLTAAFATGVAAARGMLAWMDQTETGGEKP